MRYKYAIGERVRPTSPVPFTGRLGIVESRHLSHGVIAYYTLRFVRPIIRRGWDIRAAGPYAFPEVNVRPA